MPSAERLFSDTLAIHLSEIPRKLEMATQLSDQVVYGFKVVKRNWYRTIDKNDQ